MPGDGSVSLRSPSQPPLSDFLLFFFSPSLAPSLAFSSSFLSEALLQPDSAGERGRGGIRAPQRKRPGLREAPTRPLCDAIGRGRERGAGRALLGPARPLPSPARLLFSLLSNAEYEGGKKERKRALSPYLAATGHQSLAPTLGRVATMQMSRLSVIIYQETRWGGGGGEEAIIPKRFF